MPSQLELQAVTVTYGDVIAASEVSLTLARGDIACLLGPSGCGKSTLLRAIGGFEPVAGGAVVLQQEVISAPGFTLAPERRRVGMVFQDFALFPHLTVARNIGFGLVADGRAQRQRRVDELLELVALQPWARAYPHELSGGQQQRVALARALAPAPRVLLLDEPFSNLDAELREQLAGEVRTLLKRDSVTAVLVTHDQHEAFAMADHITLLRDGRVVQAASAYDLYHYPACEFAAEFMGQGAVIEVAIDRSGRLDFGLGAVATASLGSRVGASLRLLVRPDDLSFAAHSATRLPITARAFRGAHYLYELALPDGQRITCLTPSQVELAVGAEMPVAFALREAVIFDQQGRAVQAQLAASAGRGTE